MVLVMSTPVDPSNWQSTVNEKKSSSINGFEQQSFVASGDKAMVACPVPETNISKYFTTGGKNVSSKNFSGGSVDKRVSLTVSPKTYDRNESTFVEKVRYVLGSKKQHQSWIKNGFNFYGLLYNALSTTSGIIFPYTPSITFTHGVNYETIQINHSNFAYNCYKNTPPPTISLTTKFTADNRDNALQMLSAIWFFTACSKCEFGERSGNDLNGNALAGLPPPILYLNGYDSLIDNIPVLISNFNYTLQDEKHYVNLVLDMSKDYTKGEEFCKIYDTYTQTQNMTLSKSFFDIDIGNMVNKTIGSSNSKVSQRGINLSFWLPTDLTITVNLVVQPNVLKVQKQWKLDDYKTGLLIHNKGKNPPVPNNTFVDEILEPIGMDIPSGKMQCIKKEVLKVNNLELIPSGWTW